MDRDANTRAPVSVEEAVDLILTNLSEKDLKILRDIKDQKGLYLYHHGFGRYIRNAFGLWSGDSALLADCKRVAVEAGQKLSDPSTHPDFLMHPDDASHAIIVALWKKVRV